MDKISVSVIFSESNVPRAFCGSAEFGGEAIVDSVSLSGSSTEGILKTSGSANQDSQAAFSETEDAGESAEGGKGPAETDSKSGEAADKAGEGAFEERQGSDESLNSPAVGNIKAINGQIAKKSALVSSLNLKLEAGRGKSEDADREIAEILNYDPAKGREDNIEEQCRERALKLAALEEEYQNKLREQERLEEREGRLVEEITEAKNGGSGQKAQALIDELNTLKPQLEAAKGEAEALAGSAAGCRAELDSLNAALMQKREEADSEKQSRLANALSKQEDINRQTEAAEREQKEAASEVKELQSRKAAESKTVSLLQSSFKQAQSVRQKAAAVLNLSKIENLRKKAELAANLLKSKAADANVVSAQAALAAAEAAAFINPSLIAAAKLHLQTAEGIAEAAHLQVGKSEAESAASENKLKASDLAFKAAEAGVKALDSRLKNAQSSLKRSDMFLRQGLSRQKSAGEELDIQKRLKEKIDNFIGGTSVSEDMRP